MLSGPIVPITATYLTFHSVEHQPAEEGDDHIEIFGFQQGIIFIEKMGKLKRM